MSLVLPRYNPCLARTSCSSPQFVLTTLSLANHLNPLPITFLHSNLLVAFNVDLINLLYQLFFAFKILVCRQLTSILNPSTKVTNICFSKFRYIIEGFYGVRISPATKRPITIFSVFITTLQMIRVPSSSLKFIPSLQIFLWNGINIFKIAFLFTNYWCRPGVR